MGFNYTKEIIAGGLTYAAYRAQVAAELATEPKDEEAAKLRAYMKRNATLMDGFDTNYSLNTDLESALMKAPKTTWLVLTEGWCGDAAFSVPLFAVLEKALPEKIQLRVLLRDSNLELMDEHLTDGGRAIPKLIVLNENLQEVGTWGPRPDLLQILMKNWKSEGLGLKEIIPLVHKWYNTDATVSLQQELTTLVKSYS